MVGLRPLQIAQNGGLGQAPCSKSTTRRIRVADFQAGNQDLGQGLGSKSSMRTIHVDDFWRKTEVLDRASVRSRRREQFASTTFRQKTKVLDRALVRSHLRANSRRRPLVASCDFLVSFEPYIRRVPLKWHGSCSGRSDLFSVGDFRFA